jgi:nucleotide-binding universal stress UspA family protein
MSNQTQWLLGLEPSPRSSGALQFARWLRETLHGHVLGVHVSELWVLGFSEGVGAGYLVAARAETERWFATLRPGAADAAIDATEILDANDAESGLAEAGRGALGILVGRRVAGDGAWVRLGRVTRRLLRRLPAPVIVVPPEVTADTLRGPILLASSLDEPSVSAARFAVRFAQQAGRPLVCVHVGQPRWDEGFSDVDPRWAELRASYRDATERSARRWVDEHCPGAALVFEYGDPAEHLPAVAGLLQASLLVLGSARPGLAVRMFAGSTASLTAAIAPCAVAVVPPDAKLPRS